MKKRRIKKYLNIIAFELASWVLFLFARILYFTCRTEIKGHKKISHTENSPQPFIYAFWHGRLFPTSFLYTKKKKVYAIISNHKDGELIARVVSKFGVHSVRGSTNRMPNKDRPFKNRGGANVIRESISIFEEGNTIAITPDGPRGPARKAKKNFFKLALEKNISVILVSYSASKCVEFSSWDNFMLPLPFSKIYVTLDEIKNPRDTFGTEGLEQFASQVEERLNDITEQADKIAKENS